MHAAPCPNRLPAPPICYCRSVRWHMATLGSETDMHNLHIHGNTFLK